jgi:hypothetical protein
MLLIRFIFVAVNVLVREAERVLTMATNQQRGTHAHRGGDEVTTP